MRKIITKVIVLILLISFFCFFPVFKNIVTSSSIKTILFSSNTNELDYDIILFESFENNKFPPLQWENVTNNKNYSWQLDTMNTYTGNYSACCFHDPYRNPQNEWLITPPI